ncbi:MAG: hypothetical protein ACLFQR_10805, partial [Desulfovibrionales bacterium]
RRLAVVDVTDGPDIHMRLRPLKLRLAHSIPPEVGFTESIYNTISIYVAKKKRLVPKLEWSPRSDLNR